MKKLFNLMIAAATLVMGAACTQNDEVDAPTPTFEVAECPTVSLDGETVELAYTVTNAVAGATVTVTEPTVEWIHDVVVGKEVITFVVDAYAPQFGAEARTGSFDVCYATLTPQTITVTQSAPVTTFTVGTVEPLAAAGGEASVAYTIENAVAGAEVTASEPTAEWLHSVTVGEGVVTFKKNVDDKVVPNIHCEAEWIKNVTATTSEISYTVEPNHIAEARFSVISVEVYGVAHEVIINQEAAEPVLTVTSENTVVVGSEGGERKVTYITNVPNDTNNPAVRTTADWISEIKQEEDGTITFEIAPNEIAEARSAIVKIEYADQEYDVVVEQVAAEPVLTITSETPVNMTADGGGATVTYTTNVPNAEIPIVECDVEWVRDIVVEKGSISYVVDANTLTESRVAAIKVSSYGNTEYLIIRQQKAAPDMIVVDAENELMGIKKSESVVIYFRQGASVIDRNYMNNGENL